MLLRRVLPVLAPRFRVLGVGVLAGLLLVVNVPSYLCVVPPCVSLEFPSPPILASLSFLSAVWNGPVV